MHEDRVAQRLEHDAIVTEHRPTLSSQSEGERRFSATTLSHEQVGQPFSVNNSGRVNVVAVVLAKSKHGANTRERLARTSGG